MRVAGRHHHNAAGGAGHLAVADGEQRLALLHDEHLGVGVAVQVVAAAGESAIRERRRRRRRRRGPPSGAWWHSFATSLTTSITRLMESNLNHSVRPIGVGCRRTPSTVRARIGQPVQRIKARPGVPRGAVGGPSPLGPLTSGPEAWMLKPRRGPGSKPRFAAASPVVGSARTIGGVRRAASGGIQFTAHAHSPNIRGVGSPGGVVLPATVGTE